MSFKKFDPPLLFIRGFPYPGYPTYSKQTIESAQDYQPQDGDLFIVTYPKSGTTWLTYIVYEIVNRGEQLPSMEDMNYKLIPYNEMCGVSAGATPASSSGIFKYHSPYELIPKSDQAKYIYLYRNPKDALISRYFFTKEIMNCDIDFDEFLECFLFGGLAYGLWSNHVLSWYEYKNEPNILFISYEEMSENRNNSVLKIANFLGKEYEESLMANGNNLLNTILERTSFDYMKKQLPVALPSSAGNGVKKFRSINFFRKGLVGDWKNHLSPEQNGKVNSMIKEKFMNTDLLEEFLN